MKRLRRFLTRRATSVFFALALQLAVLIGFLIAFTDSFVVFPIFGGLFYLILRQDPPQPGRQAADEGERRQGGTPDR